MLKHFYILYYNFELFFKKWDRSSGRAEDVASFYICIIIGEWFVLFYLVIDKIFPKLNSFFYDYKTLCIALGLAVAVIAYIFIPRIFGLKISQFRYELENNRGDWKRSKFRKWAIFWTIVYFVLFPWLLIALMIFLDYF